MSQERQITRDTVFASATEPVLWCGCDFKLFWLLAGLCALAAIFLFAAFGFSLMTFGGIAVDGVVFFAGTAGLRVMAKHDPLMWPIYIRHIRWPGWIPATGRMVFYRRPRRLFRIDARREGR